MFKDAAAFFSLEEWAELVGCQEELCWDVTSWWLRSLPERGLPPPTALEDPGARECGRRLLGDAASCSSHRAGLLWRMSACFGRAAVPGTCGPSAGDPLLGGEEVGGSGRVVDAWPRAPRCAHGMPDVGCRECPLFLGEGHRDPPQSRGHARLPAGPECPAWAGALPEPGAGAPAGVPQPGRAPTAARAGEFVLGVRRLASLQSERCHCHGSWHFPTEDFPLGGGAAGCPASLGSLHHLCAHVPVLAGAQHAFCCSAPLSRGRVTPWGPPLVPGPFAGHAPCFRVQAPF